MININQHNYEEFFLLYVDGELSATDKLAVERFVQENPDLAVELEMLQQSQLPVENWGFEDKKLLYRNESAGINTANHEEQFLLYVDNELNTTARESVERFVLQHPALQESFTLLKQTKLKPEQILFPDKATLYRKEEKERRIVYMNWQRITVAAVLTGVAVLLWTVIPQNKNNEPVLARQTVNENVLTAPLAANKNNDAATVASHSVNSVTINKNTTVGSPYATQSLNTTLPVNQSGDLLAANSEPVRTADPVRTDAEVISTGSANEFETVPSSTLRVSGDNPVLDNVDMVKAVNTPDNNNSTENAQPAVYRELDTESADQKKSLLVGSLEINKDKLRGFFRKAGSIFRSKAKTEEEPASTNTRSLK